MLMVSILFMLELYRCVKMGSCRSVVNIAIEFLFLSNFGHQNQVPRWSETLVTRKLRKNGSYFGRYCCYRTNLWWPYSTGADSGCSGARAPMRNFIWVLSTTALMRKSLLGIHDNFDNSALMPYSQRFSVWHALTVCQISWFYHQKHNSSTYILY